MSKLKKRVFKIAIVVLIVLILFTLLSKTVYNLMLPEVRAATPTMGSLSSVAQEYYISGIVSGTVEPAAPVEVTDIENEPAATPEDTAPTEPVEADEPTPLNLYSATVNMSYSELFLLTNQESVWGYVSTLDKDMPNIQVAVTVSSYAYNELTSSFSVVLEIESEIPLEIGLPISVTIREERASSVQSGSAMQTLVPVNALFRDGESYYVYRMDTQDTFWGKTYVAHRIDIELIDSNYTQASVDGIGNELPVIYSTSKSLYDGAPVRLVQ